MNNSILDKSILGIVKVRSLLTFVCSALLFALISWVFFYPNDVQGDKLRQPDTMQGIANTHEISTYRAQTGTITRWTNAMFSGMPTFQTNLTYKNSPCINAMAKVYSLGMPEPVNWAYILMLGFFILMLACGVKWYLAVLGAIAYGFSSYFFILIGAGHIWKLLTLAYIPPTLAGIVLAYRGKYLGGAALAAIFATLQLASNHVQMTYYSLFIIAALAIAYLVIDIKAKRVKGWLEATSALACAAVLAVAANAPALYMTYKYSKETIRGNHSELSQGAQQPEAKASGGLDKDYITSWSYGIDETFTLMIPNVKGGATIRPEKGDSRMLSLADTPQADKLYNDSKIGQSELQYLSQFPQYFGDQPMTNGPVYVGIIIFALFLLGCFIVKGPVKWALLIVTILSVLLSWGHNMMWFSDLFIDYFPLYDRFRAVSSILVIAEITIPMLAVLALGQMLDDNDFLAHHKKAFFGTFGFCALVCLLTWLAPSMFGTFSKNEVEQVVPQLQQFPSLYEAIGQVRHGMIASDALRSLVFLLLGGGLLYFVAATRKLNAMQASLALAALVLVDMYMVDKRYVNSDCFISSFEIDDAEPAFTPRLADKQILADTAQNYRVYDLQHFSEAMPSYFHKAIGGYHPAKLTRYNDLIERQISKGNIAVLNMLNTKYVIVSDSLAQVNPDAMGNAWFVDTLTFVNGPDAEMRFLDHFNPANHAVADAKFTAALGKAQPKAAGDTIFETTYAPNRLTYHSHSGKGGVAVFSEVYFPWGWHVTIDGKDATASLGRVNYVLRALNVPAGDHTIIFEFNPTEVAQAEDVSIAALVLIFLLAFNAVALAAVKGMRRERKAQGDAASEQ